MLAYNSTDNTMGVDPRIVCRNRTTFFADNEVVMKPDINTAGLGDEVLRSSLSGMWYSGVPDELESEIKAYFDAAPDAELDDIIALLLPHAGYAYSGQVAASAVAQLRGHNYDRVVVLGPTHQFEMRNMISVPAAKSYSTPLGEVELDGGCIELLAQHNFVQTSTAHHQQEHSVQIEIPLLQIALEKFKLVPIVVGQLDLENCLMVGAALRELMDERTLLVVSSDFTHYGARFGYLPFKEDIPEGIKNIDMGAYNYIDALDPRGFMQYCSETGATICGRIPIAILLAMLPDDSGAHLIQYETSGNLTGCYDASVSYLSAAFTGGWANSENSSQDDVCAEDDADPLADRDKLALLKLARAVLDSYLRNGGRAHSHEPEIEVTDGMRKVMGAFVTLKKNGKLRGCIGEIFPRRELYKAVIAHAINAGVNDHRFPAVCLDELSSLKIEISALTPPRQVDSYGDIEVGRHGVLLEKGLRAAVFLPQVAPEQGWNVEEMLENLALKAGLPADGWRDEVELKVFEAIVFCED